MPITNFTDGLALRASNEPLGNLGVPLDPIRYAVWCDDFITIPVVTATTGQYVLTQTNGSLAAVAGGFNLVCAGADNDLAQLQGNGATVALVAGKKFFFEWRGRIIQGATGVVGQEEVFIGLTGIQTGANFMNANGLVRTFDNGLGFIHYDDDTTAALGAIQVASDSPSTEAAATTYTDNTFLRLSIYFDGTSVRYYKDGVQVANLTSNRPTAVVTPTLYIAAGEAKGKTLQTDYMCIVQER